MKINKLNFSVILIVNFLIACGQSSPSPQPNLTAEKQSDQQPAPGTPGPHGPVPTPKEADPLSPVDITFEWVGADTSKRYIHDFSGSTRLFIDSREVDAKHFQSRLQCSTSIVNGLHVLKLSIDNHPEGQWETNRYDNYDLTLTTKQPLEVKEYFSSDFNFPRMGLHGCLITSTREVCFGKRRYSDGKDLYNAKYKVMSLEPLSLMGSGTLYDTNLQIRFQINCDKVKRPDETKPIIVQPTLSSPPSTLPAPSHPTPPQELPPEEPELKLEIKKQYTCFASETVDYGKVSPRKSATLILKLEPKADVILSFSENWQFRFGEVKFDYYDFDSQNSKCKSRTENSSEQFSISSSCDYFSNKVYLSTLSGVVILDKNGNGSFETYGQPVNFKKSLLKSYQLSGCK